MMKVSRWVMIAATAAAVAVVAGCAAPPAAIPEDLDGLGVSDTRFDTTNFELFSTTQPGPAEMEGKISSWSSGTEFQLNGHTFQLHGVRHSTR